MILWRTQEVVGLDAVVEATSVAFRAVCSAAKIGVKTTLGPPTGLGVLLYKVIPYLFTIMFRCARADDVGFRPCPCP